MNYLALWSQFVQVLPRYRMMEEVRHNRQIDLCFSWQDEEIGKLKSRYGDMESSYNQVKYYKAFFQK